jgi:hypothetical protein
MGFNGPVAVAGGFLWADGPKALERLSGRQFCF